jgi:hypothetical protein
MAPPFHSASLSERYVKDKLYGRRWSDGFSSLFYCYLIYIYTHLAFPSTNQTISPILSARTPPLYIPQKPLNPTTETHKKPSQKPQIHQAPLCTAPIPFPRFPPPPLSLPPLPLPSSAETRIIPPCTYAPSYRPRGRCLIRQCTGALGLSGAAKGVDRALGRWEE